MSIDRAKEFVTVATGPTSGIYYPIGGAFATALGNAGYKTSAQATGASVENINLILNGEAELAIAMQDSVVQAYEGFGAFEKAEPDLRAMMRLWPNYVQLVTVASTGIKSVEDLKGKKVAYSSGTSSEDILMNSLTKAGMTMDDIEAVDMDASGIVTAMISGGVDACATWSPNSLKILDELPDATKLTDNLTFADTTVSLASWIATEKYANENQDKLLRFTRALFKGMDYAADDHYDEVAEYVAKQTATDYDSVYQQRGDADWLTGAEVSKGAADGTVENYYKIQQDNFIKSGAVEKEVPVADYVMLDIMKEAGK